MGYRIMLATDWTFDMFMGDCVKYDEGVKLDDEYREYFIGWFKEAAQKFEENWKASHNGRLYDRADGYVGDAFADTLNDWFSDFYKDAYGQRPHLERWYYVQATGLPHSEDTARTFCARPVADAMEAARENREV